MMITIENVFGFVSK